MADALKCQADANTQTMNCLIIAKMVFINRQSQIKLCFLRKFRSFTKIS